MITTICFVDDIYRSFAEANRILKNSGNLIIGFVDKESPVGKIYLKLKAQNLFYKDALFYRTEEVYKILENRGFLVEETWQTVFGNLEEINRVQEVITGSGKGSFIVIKARKNKYT